MNRTGKEALWLVAGHAAVVVFCCGATYAMPDHPPEGAQIFSEADGARLLFGALGVPALFLSLLVCLIALSISAARRGQPPEREFRDWSKFRD
ncbi:hypothetical protein Ais01nite_00550 [Asanoa ishikariensis]|uniref:Uncharacterized protein n=1 Tax=Asanoa ishikariensis TaxID=137265 RepID=A0A1H3TPQ0_9ACTN|nr:hypothetical protein [Asanoa ishikariensis]GIF62020.1 hypothetical protein Ais01nite_00550 [Asanoa ishikariensis]SDZ52194.1 hypothetical protein SAMN05421684_6168 [Asanoa ishikariensis]